MRPFDTPAGGPVPAAAGLGRPVHILLVDDSEADVRLTVTALERARAHVTLDRARDGIEALELLRAAGSRRPDLVLLDLNMPRMDGREALREIKQDPDLRSIPVVVLTTSKAEEYTS